MTHLDRRAFLSASGAALVSAAVYAPGVALTAPSPPTIDPAALVHPDLREALARFGAMDKDNPPLSAATLPRQREMMNGFYAQPLAEVPYEERKLPAGADHPEVRVYVINGAGSKGRPAILHMHGGGFVSGEARGSIRPMQQLARELDCVIVTVDYRLAPESRWNASLADNYSALRWMDDSAVELGIDRRRIAVMGESAGGGHAALLALTARDRGEVPVAAQVLIYPMLDDRTGNQHPVPAHIGAFGWNAAANRVGWQSFLGTEPGGRHVPAAAVPARARSLAGLPPAFIGVGAIDLFVGEDMDYARRLVSDGVATELVVVPGAFHGFDFVAPESPMARRFRTSWTSFLRYAFGLPES